jgi:hypothetical protein
MNSMRKEMQDRMEERRKERETLSNRLREKYAPNLPEKITNMIFNKAWDDGHASGEHEVEYAYDEIATIANALLKMCPAQV